jgi:hypothetical protein
MDAVLNWSPVIAHYAACICGSSVDVAVSCNISSSTRRSDGSGHNNIQMLCDALDALLESLRLLGRCSNRQQGGRVRLLIMRLLCHRL